MKVTASLFKDYLFEPEYGELQQLGGVFAGRLILTDGGYTFRIYSTVPDSTVKGAEYFGKVATKTVSFPTKQAALNSLKSGVEVTGNRILNAEQGLYLPGRGIGHNPLGVMTDHIPQIYGLYPTAAAPDTVCVSVNGWFDLNTKTFKGQMAFARLGEIWNA